MMQMLPLLIALLSVPVGPPEPVQTAVMDLRWFPGRDVAFEGYTRTKEMWGRIRNEFGPSCVWVDWHVYPEFKEAAQHSDWCWWYLNCAHTASSASYRLHCLERLRDHLGDADYFAGEMPAPVPLSYYKEQR